jgi:hypothetical protein
MYRTYPTYLACLVVLLLACPDAAGAQTPPAAEAVVASAVSTAQASRRAVLIEFGASWCTWCRNFEAFVKAPDTAAIIAKHFVVLNLIVRERDDKTALEHPGGNAIMDRWGGAKSGLPFYVFLDGNGRKVADSNAMPDGSNIGFPAVPAEIAAFMRLMRTAAPGMTDGERRTLETYLTRVMPKPSGD